MTCDDLGLRLLDRAGADRAEQLDLLEQVLGGALGEVADDLVADVGAHALERGGQVVGLDLAQHQLQRPVVDGDDVLEDEHLRADLLGELGVACCPATRGSSARWPRRAVDDLDQRLDAADRGHRPGCSSEPIRRSQLLLDQADHLRRGAVHDGDPVRDLGLLLRREAGEDLGRLRGGQVGQHQRDRSAGARP